MIYFPHARAAQSQRPPVAFAAAWLLAFAIPWEDMILLPRDVQFSRVLSLIVIVVWIASRATGGRIRRPNQTHLWMVAFVFLACLSIFWSEYPSNTFRRSLSYLQLFLVAWAIFQFSANRQQFISLLQAVIFGEYVLLVFVAASFYTGVHVGDGRYSAPGVNVNDLANTLALGVPIACYLLAEGLGRWSWLNAIYVPFTVVCVILNASRGGIVTLAMSMIFPLLLLSMFSWKIRIAVAAMLLLSVYAALGLADTASWSRLATFNDQVAARDLNGRVDVWDTAITMFKRNPTFGLGAGAFTRVTGSTQALAIAGHNSFLEVLTENGAVGLALFLGIIVTLARRRPGATNLETQLWRVTLAAWFVANLALSWENRSLTWLLWGLALGYPAPGVKA